MVSMARWMRHSVGGGGNQHQLFLSLARKHYLTTTTLPEQHSKTTWITSSNHPGLSANFPGSSMSASQSTTVEIFVLIRAALAGPTKTSSTKDAGTHTSLQDARILRKCTASFKPGFSSELFTPSSATPSDGMTSSPKPSTDLRTSTQETW